MVKETIDQFTKLQDLDSRILEVDTQLMKIPEMLKEIYDSYETLVREKEDAAKEYAEYKEQLMKEEGVVAQNQELLVNAQKKLVSVQNNKEYEAALKELDSLKKNIANSEAKISEMTARMDELNGVVAAKTEASEEKYNGYLSQKEEKELENKSLFDELAKLKKERESFVATMKKSLVARYERIRSARNNIAISPLDGEICTGCCMKLPPQLAVEVKKERELLQCPYCQRFLYSPRTECNGDRHHTAEAS